MQDNHINNLDSEDINLKEIIYKYFIYWKWFVFSLSISIIFGFIYLQLTPKKYLSQAKILINTNNSDNMSLFLNQNLSEFSGLNNSKIDDQIEVLKSRRLMTQVVSNLDLNIQYYQKKLLLTQEYDLNKANVTLKFIDQKDKAAIDTVYIVDVIVKSKNKFLYKESLKKTEYEGVFGKPITLSFGKVILLPNHNIKIDEKTTIKISPIIKTALKFINLIDIQSLSKSSNIISFEIKGELPDSNNNLVDLLVKQYENDIVDDKNKVGETTINFINDRLKLISQDLNTSDQSMEKFKSKSGITNVITEGEVAVQQSFKTDEQLKQYMLQLSLVDYMNKYIKSNSKSLIPSNIGLTDPSIIQATQQYNQLVLERDNLLKSSTEENPIIKNLDQRLYEFNDNLKSSLRNYQRTTELAISNIKTQLGSIKNNISELPTKERGFRDIARKQQTVEALYLLLLQKREEAEIATASTPNVVKIVDKSYYLEKPISPNKLLVYLISILLGVIFPFFILYFKFLLDNKVKTKKDIEKIVKDINITGYIPRSKDALIDIKSVNSPVAEAFRVLRTDINFLLPSMKDNSKCIYITSTISGEGKSFVAVNLSFTLALTNKKVLIVEADIRKPKVREYLKIPGNPQGITEYLSGNMDSLSENIITVNYPENDSVKIDLLASGRKAPNPSELFMNGRFKNIIDYGLNNYDFVIVDTAPVSAVTDTLLINDQANLLLYVVRANYLDKNLLDIPKQLFSDKKFKNHQTAILINDVDLNKGYGYGYGYGYSDKQKPWFKRLKFFN